MASVVLVGPAAVLRVSRMQRFRVFTLDPHSVHLDLSSPVDLQASVDVVHFLNETSICKQISQLLCKESRANMVHNLLCAKLNMFLLRDQRVFQFNNRNLSSYLKRGLQCILWPNKQVFKTNEKGWNSFVHSESMWTNQIHWQNMACIIW